MYVCEMNNSLLIPVVSKREENSWNEHRTICRKNMYGDNFP